MKLKRIELDAVGVNHRGDWVFLTLTTESGIAGIGELLAGREYAGRIRAVHRLANRYLGADLIACHETTRRIVAQSPDTDTMAAVSALDQALWDLDGKSRDRSIRSLLGEPRRKSIRVYANINRATTDRTPNGFACNAAAAVADGFDTVKLAPFDGLPFTDEVREAAQGIACVRAVREAIGPNIDLMVDCHSRFTYPCALQVAEQLNELRLYWIEQPIPETQRDACIEFNERCEMTVAGAEQRSTVQSFVEAIDDKSMDVIMPDIVHVGGIGGLKSISDHTTSTGVAISPHGPRSPVALMAAAQVMAASPHFTILESAWGEVPWRHRLVIPKERIEKGRLILNQGPGLGMHLNREVLEEHRQSIASTRIQAT